MQKRSTYDDEGAFVRILDYEEDEDSEYDRVVVRIPPDDPDIQQVRCYVGDQIEYETNFQDRELKFDPVSIMGRGESESLQGVSPATEPYDNIPRDIMVAMNGLGLAVVPDGDWWLSL